MDTKISKTELLTQLQRLQTKFEDLETKLEVGGVIEFCDDGDREELTEEIESLETQDVQIGKNVDSLTELLRNTTNRMNGADTRINDIHTYAKGLEERIRELSRNANFRNDGEYTKLNKTVENLNEVNGRQAAQHVQDLDTIMRLQWQNQANSVRYEAVEAFLKSKGILAEFNEWVSRSSYANVMETIKKVGIDPRKILPM